MAKIYYVGRTKQGRTLILILVGFTYQVQASRKKGIWTYWESTQVKEDVSILQWNLLFIILVLCSHIGAVNARSSVQRLLSENNSLSYRAESWSILCKSQKLLFFHIVTLITTFNLFIRRDIHLTTRVVTTWSFKGTFNASHTLN